MNETLSEQLAQELADINARAYQESQKAIQNYVMKKRLLVLESANKEKKLMEVKDAKTEEAKEA